MNGKENWKWGAVFILLAIFLVTASQAYKAINNQEDFEPPTDWMEGDSYDIEQRTKSVENVELPQTLNRSGNGEENNSEETKSIKEENMTDSQKDKSEPEQLQSSGNGEFDLENL